MKLVVDACIFVSWMIPDQPEHTVAQAFFAHCVSRGIRLYAPVIVLAEVVSAVSRFTGQPALGEVSALRMNYLPRLEFKIVDLAFARRAARMAARYSFGGADAHYAAFAQDLNSTLITNDAELLRRCPTTMMVLKPAKWLSQSA